MQPAMPDKPKIRIVLAEDHESVRQGLRALLDTRAWTAAFHRTDYDVAGAAAAIRAARLPDSLAERLGHGQ